MPDKKKKAASSSASSKTNVTRIKASDATPAAKTTKVVKSKVAAPANTKKAKSTSKRRINLGPFGRVLRPFILLGGYFKGAWFELKQVRWPTRGATWSLTFAVIVYTAFFVLLVLLLDALFKYLFELILGK